MRSLKVWLIPLLVLGLLFSLVGLSIAEPQTKAKVIEIVDGDTLRIEFQGKIEKIRLIGVDAPECSINPKLQKDAERSGQDVKKIIEMGKKATAFVKTLVKKGDEVQD